MNKLIEQKGVELLSWIVETLKQSKDFVITQAPDVIQQMLTYEFIEKTIDIFLCLIFIVITLFLMKFVYKKAYLAPKDYNDEMQEGWALILVFSTLGTIAIILTSSFFLFYNITKLLQIKHTPKAYLIHALTDKDK